MSISAFYRTWLPVVGHYKVMRKGQAEDVYTDPIYVKANVQPTKSGLTLDANTGNAMYFTDYYNLFLKDLPKPPLELDPEWSNIDFKQNFYYMEGKWYAQMNVEDWRKANRGVKHIKVLVSGQDGVATPTIPEPIPYAELVDRFSEVVREFNNLDPLINQ